MKLVRDFIPQIIKESGKSCEYYVASTHEYKKYLYEKTHEELDEFFENPCYEEAADMYEVLSAICFLHDMTMELVKDTARNKRKKRGGFTDKIILEKVINKNQR